ncbi:MULTISPECIES: MarR family winged helix-turn-helix transcriptional regulator [Xanthocytophaga]|uniref:MarR family transcriptional regulator n=2 Tax=Xanthocytophaga TaxID=3078918 RepID=A0AAE3UC92_9BACT|nr:MULTISPECIES: MarR family transcriptional regulator [Xanthocytophaga]MDJ1484504.1 MarR family transcriptional regulator [Xanthocytophaga flavus]MDJ1499080.1 MarR family transcriptional regulator [Xanthocytophaga agilis]
MELEKEIQQPRFQNQFQKLILNIVFTANWLDLKQIQLLKPYDVSPQQYNILRILRGQHPKAATVSLLTERMLDKSSNASRLVEKLRVKKFLEREECPEDRRAVNVKITDKGLELLKKLDPLIGEVEKSMHMITEDEAKAFNDFLDQLRD